MGRVLHSTARVSEVEFFMFITWDVYFKLAPHSHCARISFLFRGEDMTRGVQSLAQEVLLTYSRSFP